MTTPFRMLLLLIPLAAACRRSEAPHREAAGPLVTAPAPPHPPQLPSPPPPPPPPPAAEDAAPARAAGDWLEGDIYRFRLEQAKRCGSSQLAAVVRVSSKVPDLFVSARDVTLERDGIIVQSTLATKPPPGCPALLGIKVLRTGKEARGAVLFDIPPGFDVAARPVTFAYHPTRWGGASRVAVKRKIDAEAR
jgi:hypothetical protein